MNITPADSRELRYELYRDVLLGLLETISNFFLARYHKEAIRFVREIGKSGDIVMDLGCSKGRFTKAFMTAFNCSTVPERLYCGVDVDPDRLLEAADYCDLDGPLKTCGFDYANSNRSVMLFETSALDLTAPDKSMDMVVCIMMFHHIDPAHYQQVVKEISRVLKPNGLFLLIEHGRPTSLLGWIAYKLFSGHAYAHNCAEKVKTTAEHIGFHKASTWGNKTLFGWTHCLVFPKW